MNNSKNVNVFIVIVAILLTSNFIYSQEDTKKDRFTALNAVIETVYYTQYGLIVEFVSEGKIRQVYIPNKFFDELIAIKITEDTGAIAPQISVIYRNLEPYRIKLYLPDKPVGPQYQTLEYLSNEAIDKFKNTQKIEISFWDKQESTSKQ